MDQQLRVMSAEFERRIATAVENHETQVKIEKRKSEDL